MSDDEPIDIRTWKPKGYYDNPVLVGANGVQIAGNSEYNTLSDNMIDNFMIAAAPELLRTLTNLINATNVNADELDPLTVFVAIEQAKGAIAKATGDV